MDLTTKRRIRLTRDGILFTVGLAGIIHETVIAETVRVDLLLLFAGMVGLPAFIRSDESDRKGAREGNDVNKTDVE